MKALLLKDWYMAKKYLKSYIYIILVFLGLCFFAQPHIFTFVFFFPCMYCSMFPTTLLAYDEKSGWDRYCCTLPVTRAQYVTAKYLVGAIPTAIAIPCVLFAVIIGNALRGNFSLELYGVILAFLIIVSTVLPGISYMLMFRYGTEHSRYSYYLVIGAASAASLFLSPILLSMEPSVSMGMLLTVGTLLSIGFYIFSWRMSIGLYEKRELG